MNQPVMRTGAAAGVVLGLCVCIAPEAFARQEKAEKANQIVIKADDVSDRGASAPKVRPGRRRRSPPFTVKVMADPTNVQSPQASLTRLIIGPASRVAMHRHPRSAKVLYLIKGRARVLGPPGPKTLKMMPGSAVFLPPGYPHIIENMARQAHATFLQAFSPPGPERVYRDPKNKEARADFEVIRSSSGLKAPPGPKPVLATAEGATTIKIAGGKGVARILLEEKSTGSSAMALSVMEFDGGAELPRHAHTSASELLYVISGSGKVTVAGQTMSFGSDTAIYIPADQPHAAKMSGGSTLAVQIYAPAGPEQRFRGANPPAAGTGVQTAAEPPTAKVPVPFVEPAAPRVGRKTARKEVR